ncbi:hypothetical protein BGX31_004955, partial [Mortierella sp. GBA43]
MSIYKGRPSASFRETITDITRGLFMQAQQRIAAITPSYLFQSPGNTLAVQYKRYFRDADRGKPSSFPLTPIRNSFISLTERELLLMLWKIQSIQPYLKYLGMQNGTEAEVSNLLNNGVGLIINTFISPIGLPRHQVHSHVKSGYFRQTTTMTDLQLSEHLQWIVDGTPIPNNPLNGAIRYVLRGGFLTNGVQLQLRAINTRVFGRHKYATAQNRHSPTMALMHDPREGYNAYLREIRNHFPDPQD